MLCYVGLQVKFCPVCQRINKRLNWEHPELPVKSPMYHTGINFVGPISPISSSGNWYILTVSDYFIRFGWAKALLMKEANNVVSALKEIIDLVYKSTLRLRYVYLSHAAILHHGYSTSSLPIKGVNSTMT